MELEPQIDELISKFVEGVGDSLHALTYTAYEYQILAEKIHQLEVEREELRAIARRLDNLDAAELLQKLRAKNAKSKTTLRDVEIILEVMDNSNQYHYSAIEPR